LSGYVRMIFFYNQNRAHTFISREKAVKNNVFLHGCDKTSFSFYLFVLTAHPSTSNNKALL
jgi:hypothetical protein